MWIVGTIVMVAVVWFLGSVVIANYIDRELAWRFRHQNTNWGNLHTWDDDWHSIVLVCGWPVALPLALPWKLASVLGRKLNDRVHRTEAIVEELAGKEEK